MPLQNRVSPDASLHALPFRGQWMGNRGCLHNAQQQLVRPFQTQRWIICLLDFKNRRRPLMQPGHYTELFFMDEASAFAAGHRPCAECQREKYLHFKESWLAANPQHGLRSKVGIDAIDTILHHERMAAKPLVNPQELPDGSFVKSANACFMVLEGRLLEWSFGGYTQSLPLVESALLLTPPSVVNCLRRGMKIEIKMPKKENIN